MIAPYARAICIYCSTRYFTFFAMLSHTQVLGGFTSLVGEDRHIIMWDLEKCTQDEAIETLCKVQLDHRLGDIYIVSDSEGSYRGWRARPLFRNF